MYEGGSFQNKSLTEPNRVKIKRVTDTNRLCFQERFPGSPLLLAFQQSIPLRSRLSGVPMGPKLEKGMAPWLWVGGEDGRLLGLDE